MMSMTCAKMLKCMRRKVAMVCMRCLLPEKSMIASPATPSGGGGRKLNRKSPSPTLQLEDVAGNLC